MSRFSAKTKLPQLTAPTRAELQALDTAGVTSWPQLSAADFTERKFRDRETGCCCLTGHAAFVSSSGAAAAPHRVIDPAQYKAYWVIRDRLEQYARKLVHHPCSAVSFNDYYSTRPLRAMLWNQVGRDFGYTENA